MFTSELRTIIDNLLSHNFTPYIVGGFTRDTVLGVQSKDMDIEVFGCSIQQLENVLSQLGRVDTVGKKFGVIKLTTSNGDYDFSIPRRDNKVGVGRSGFEVEFDQTLTPKQAAARRDFTFNAMFLDKDCNLVDPHNGVQDLMKNRLRHTSSAFNEDPTRVLRGMRFCGQLNLRPCRTTIKVCKEMSDRYSEIESDMIWAEWSKWATRSIKPSRGLGFLWITGWIHHYPELYALTRLPQEPKWHPEGTAWQHTKHVVDQMNEICQRDFIVGDKKIINMFGALLHDVGKAVTTTVNSAGEIVSPGHDEAGVEIAHSFMERINMPKHYRDAVAEVVRYHMRHINNPTAKAARRFASVISNIDKNDWLRIVEADHSGRPPFPVGIPEDAIKLYELINEEESSNRVEQLILGRHLISNGFVPSPKFGIVLREVYEIQLDEGLSFDELLMIAIKKMEQLYGL